MAPAKDSIFSKYFYPVGCAIIGAGTPAISNYYIRRPYLAGIQRHITFGIAGAIVGYYIDIYTRKRWMERDAMVRHYIELHPEDFEVKRRKYKEIFDEWYPMR